MENIDFTKVKFRCHNLHGILTPKLGTKITDNELREIEMLQEKKVKGLESWEKNYGLTEKQVEFLNTLQAKLASGKITDKQKADLDSLLERQENNKKDWKDGLFTKDNDRLIELLHKRERPHQFGGEAVRELWRFYSELVYDRKSANRTRKNDYITKGLLVEDECIEVISYMSGLDLKKNTNRFENDYLSGEPDGIYPGINAGFDNKAKFDLDTFFKTIDEGISDRYKMQGKAYCDLLGWDYYDIWSVLVSHPMNMILKEKEILANSGVFIPDSPEFEEAWSEINKTISFDDIPLSHRVIKHRVMKQEDFKEQVYPILSLAREELSEMHSLRVRMIENGGFIGLID